MTVHRLLAAAAISLLVGLTVGRLAMPVSPSSPIPARLHDYCTTVHVALDMDADDFTDGSDKRKSAAAMRFGELVTYHSEQEIALCAKEPVDLKDRGVCALNRDYACLAKISRAAAVATKP